MRATCQSRLKGCPELDYSFAETGSSLVCTEPETACSHAAGAVSTQTANNPAAAPLRAPPPRPICPRLFPWMLHCEWFRNNSTSLSGLPTGVHHICRKSISNGMPDRRLRCRFEELVHEFVRKPCQGSKQRHVAKRAGSAPWRRPSSASVIIVLRKGR